MSLFLKVIHDEITVVEDVSNCSDILKRIDDIRKKFMNENAYVSLTFSSNENFYEIILKRDDFNMV